MTLRLALACLAALAGPATADPPLRRLASQGDPDPSQPGKRETTAHHGTIGASGFIAYQLESREDGNGTETLMGDDHGTPVVIARGTETFPDGTPYLGYVKQPMLLAGALLVFRAKSTFPTIATWDAAHGLRALIAQQDPLPGGGGVVTSLDVRGANEAGQVLLAVADASTSEFVLAQPDGRLDVVLRRGQSVPGNAGFSIVQLGAGFLAADGHLALEVLAFDGDPQHVETFIVTGTLGDLRLEAASSHADLDHVRTVHLLAGARDGQIAYVASVGSSSGPTTTSIRAGAPGDTGEILSASSDALPKFDGVELDARGIDRALLGDHRNLVVRASNQATFAFHAGTWRHVLAVGETAPGAPAPAGVTEPLGVTPAGIVVVRADLGTGIWRSVPGQPLETVAAPGESYDLGPAGQRVATGVGSDASIGDDGDVAVEVGWTNDGNNLRSSLFTTIVAEQPPFDLGIENPSSFVLGEMGFGLRFDVVNHSAVAVRDFAIRLDTPFDDGAVTLTSMDFACGPPLLGTVICASQQPIAPNATLKAGVLLGTHGDPGGETIAIAIIAPGDTNAANDTTTLTLLRISDDGGCSAARGQSGLFVAFAIVVFRRGRRQRVAGASRLSHSRSSFSDENAL